MQRKHNPSWPSWLEGSGLSVHSILVPLSSEHHFQSGVKYQWLVGLCLAPYTTVQLLGLG